MTVAAGAASSRDNSATLSGLVSGRWIDIGLASAIGLAACLARLPRLDYYTVSFPEGIRAEQLLLMAAGYRPCVEIFCNQGPLLFYALYPTFVLFGQTLEAVRSGVVLFSLIGICATYWVGSLVGGRPAAIVAAAIVALSPTYLKFSRLGLAEVPAVAPAIIAVGAALVFCRTGRDRWLLGAALATAVSLLLKPVTLAVCVPVGLFVLLHPARRWRNLALLTSVTAVAIVIPTLLIGFSEIIEQVVAFRLRSRAAEGRGVDWNWWRIVEEMSADRAGLIAFAATGTIVLVLRLGRAALPLVAWAAASLLLLLIHSPLHGKHIVTLIPPLALLAGAGVGLAWRSARQSPVLPTAGLSTTRVSIAIVGIGAVAYVATLPGILSQDYQTVFHPRPLENDPAAYWYPEVISTLQKITDARDTIVTDHPYLTFEARRLVPPSLVESSLTRIAARSLTADDAIEEARRYNTAAVLLWADKLATLRRFKAWVDRTYVPVQVYAADGEATPTLYVRPEQADQAGAVVASMAPTPLEIDFDGGLRLRAFGVDHTRVPVGGVTAVHLLWESVSQPTSDYQAVLQLRSEEQVVWRSEELPLAGLGPGSASWAPGRGIALSALVRPPRSLQPGEYSLSVRLYDPRARQLTGPSGAADAASQRDPKGATLTTLTITPPPAVSSR